jgi:hypothetical protein
MTDITKNAYRTYRVRGHSETESGIQSSFSALPLIVFVILVVHVFEDIG